MLTSYLTYSLRPKIDDVISSVAIINSFVFMLWHITMMMMYHNKDVKVFGSCTPDPGVTTFGKNFLVFLSPNLMGNSHFIHKPVKPFWGCPTWFCLVFLVSNKENPRPWKNLIVCMSFLLPLTIVALSSHSCLGLPALAVGASPDCLLVYFSTGTRDTRAGVPGLCFEVIHYEGAWIGWLFLRQESGQLSVKF